MLQKIHRQLGIPVSYFQDTGMPIHAEAGKLVSIGLDISGRPQMLVPEAAKAWRSMELGASREGVSLIIVSAFRSINYQASLIKTKLDQGQLIDDILRVNAAPGYSEHHTGRAIDLTTPDCELLCETFDKTDAFYWLRENARKYNFTMSYPKNNNWGIDYEPWHWCYEHTLTG